MQSFENKLDDEKQKRTKKPAFVRPLSSDNNKTRVTRDYSSPSLGPRRIGSPCVAGASSRAEPARRQDISSSSSEGSDEEVQPPARNLGLWKPPKQQQQEENKLDGSGAARVDYSSPSLIPRRILEKKQEVTGASSRARGAVEDNKEDDSMFRGAMSGMQANSSRLLVDLARTPEGSERAITPKPAYIQRLDRPGSALAQLEQSKDALQKMLAHALSRVDLVKPSSFDLVYGKLLRAVEALEEGTTIASYRANEPPLPTSHSRKERGEREER